MKERIRILDLWVDTVTMAMAKAEVIRMVEEEHRAQCVFAVNPEKVLTVPAHPDLHRIFHTAGLLIPDGVGVVLAGRILYGKRFSRVPGVELMDEICRLSAERGYKIFLYGSSEEVSLSASTKLQGKYPSLQIAGRANGYVPESGMDALIQSINASGAQILFLALGSPRQELWYQNFHDRLTHVRVCQGVGGTLDTIAGTVRRAPKIFCSLGLEWLYRLLREPSRIGRQKNLPIFALKILRERIAPRGIDGRK